MKLSDYAKKLGITYKTAWRLWKQGKLDAFQLPSGTIIVNVKENEPLEKGIKKDEKNSKV